MARPDFTNDQRKRLEKLGVLPEQVEKLRYAVFEARRSLRGTPERNAVKRVLNDVAKHADALMVLLVNMHRQSDMAHSEALIEVEQRYWKTRPDDIGATAACNVVPRLDALADAARKALASMPKGQTRPQASVVPIEQIDRALLNGWMEAQGPREVAIIDGEEWPAAFPPYPDKFHPRESKSFMDIVAICYEAAGAACGYVPTAAIRAYTDSRKRLNEDALAEITAAIVTPPSPRKGRSSSNRGRRQ